MKHSRWDEAKIIGAHVQGKIQSLQTRLLANDASSGSARATLAQLRSIDSGKGAWMLVGQEAFVDLPEIDMVSAEHEKALTNALIGTLQLYARHQQGNTTPMSITQRTDQGYGKSFGWSCRRIEPNLDAAHGVQRRLQSLETATDFDGIIHYLRSLVDLMRQKAVPIDYYRFARDLYLLQYPDTREKIMLAWAQDYYRSSAAAPEQETAVSTD